MKPIFISFLLFTSIILAQEANNKTAISSNLTTICTALESYKVDENGYPETLDALFPTYIKEKPEEFLNTLKYEVKEEDSYEGAGDLVYKKFLLTYKGKDNIKGTEDDIVIDTHKVIKQPEGFGLKELMIITGLLWEADNHGKT